MGRNSTLDPRLAEIAAQLDDCDAPPTFWRSARGSFATGEEAQLQMVIGVEAMQPREHLRGVWQWLGGYVVEGGRQGFRIDGIDCG